MRLIILGDIGASKSNINAFIKGERSLFSENIQSLCRKADGVLLNLEKPLTDTQTPLGKCPPDYYAPTATINGIKLLHPSIVTLANNHIMDQKKQGLHSTINILQKNGIKYVGVGENSKEARKPLLIDNNGLRIGVYACCEKEFSYATEVEAGANAFDPLESLDDISELKKKCDYLIVLYHGGMQGYPYPTPLQQTTCRRMCDKGANLVVCQHSHIVGCEEKYNHSVIVYGQGNFLLDDVSEPSWKTGLIIEILVASDKSASLRYIPVKTIDHCVAEHPESSQILGEFWERSEEIKNTDTLKKRYCQMCNKKASGYLMKLSGMPNLLQRIICRLGLAETIMKKKYRYADRNVIVDYIRCESHREAIETGLLLFDDEKVNT